MACVSTAQVSSGRTSPCYESGRVGEIGPQPDRRRRLDRASAVRHQPLAQPHPCREQQGLVGRGPNVCSASAESAVAAKDHSCVQIYLQFVHGLRRGVVAWLPRRARGPASSGWWSANRSAACGFSTTTASVRLTEIGSRSSPGGISRSTFSSWNAPPRCPGTFASTLILRVTSRMFSPVSAAAVWTRGYSFDPAIRAPLSRPCATGMPIQAFVG